MKAVKVIGSFGKGVNGSMSLNFGLSGGSNCEITCRHHPKFDGENGTQACYAAALEKRPDRTQLSNKLARHESLPAFKVVGMAIIEVQQVIAKGKRIPWFRFSTNGSLPTTKQATSLFCSQLRVLVKLLVENGIPVHLPVESQDKAEFYRSIVGDLVTVRQSLQSPGEHKKVDGPVSWVVGEQFTSKTHKGVYKLRIDAAKLQAREREQTIGRKTRVCPAVVSSMVKGNKVKCGTCTFCAVSDVDVIYPLHK